MVTKKLLRMLFFCSTELVKKVLSGERNHKKGKGQLVIVVAIKVIEAREMLCKLQL